MRLLRIIIVGVICVVVGANMDYFGLPCYIGAPVGLTISYYEWFVVK